MLKKHPYSAPLLSRKSIESYIMDRRGHRAEGREFYKFCFNVKLLHVDFSFDHLLRVYLASGDADVKATRWQDDDYILRLSKLYDTIEPAVLYDRAIDAARCNVCCDGKAEDSYRASWDSEKLHDVGLEFVGRSGGWLALISWDGMSLTDSLDLDVQDWLQDLSYSELRHFYKWLCMMEYDFSGTKTKQEVEYQASFILFENLCRKVEYPDAFIAAGI